MTKEYRRERIVTVIINSIHAANLQEMGVIEDKLIAQACLNFHCGERLIKEIVKHLKVTEEIVNIGDELWLKQNLKKELSLKQDV